MSGIDLEHLNVHPRGVEIQVGGVDFVCPIWQLSTEVSRILEIPRPAKQRGGSWENFIQIKPMPRRKCLRQRNNLMRIYVNSSIDAMLCWSLARDQ